MEEPTHEQALAAKESNEYLDALNSKYDVNWLVNEIDECVTLAHIVEMYRTTDPQEVLSLSFRKEERDVYFLEQLIEKSNGEVKANKLAQAAVPIILELRRRMIYLGSLCVYEEPFEPGEIRRPLGVDDWKYKNWNVSLKDLLRVLTPILRRIKDRLVYLEDWCN